ncbi:hypothetical protein [Chryseobacterium wanjuense]
MLPRGIPKVSIDEKPFCRLEDFGDSAVIVAVYFWTLIFLQLKIPRAASDKKSSNGSNQEG